MASSKVLGEESLKAAGLGGSAAGTGAGSSSGAGSGGGNAGGGAMYQTQGTGNGTSVDNGRVAQARQNQGRRIVGDEDDDEDGD